MTRAGGGFLEMEKDFLIENPFEQTLLQSCLPKHVSIIYTMTKETIQPLTARYFVFKRWKKTLPVHVERYC